MPAPHSCHFDRDTQSIHDGSAPLGEGYRFANAYRRDDGHPLVADGQWVIADSRHILVCDYDSFADAIENRYGETVQR